MSKETIGYKPETVVPVNAEMPITRKKEQLNLMNEIPINILVSVLPDDYLSEEVEILTSLLKY